MATLYDGNNFYVLSFTLLVAQGFYNFLHYKNQRRKNDFLRKQCPYCKREL